MFDDVYVMPTANTATVWAVPLVLYGQPIKNGFCLPEQSLVSSRVGQDLRYTEQAGRRSQYGDEPRSSDFSKRSAIHNVSKPLLGTAAHGVTSKDGGLASPDDGEEGSQR